MRWTAPARWWRSGVPDRGILLACCALFLALSVLSLRGKSATFDEPFHLTAGYLHLRHGDFRYNAMHPPLAKMLAALPLLAMDLRLPPTAGSDLPHQFLYVLNDADRMLLWARIAVLPLALLLVGAVYWWTRRLAGRAGATLAVLLCVLEPNVLAHAQLANTDLGAAAFILVTVLAWSRVMERVTAGRVVVAGLALGGALLTKLSALLLLPILLLLGAASVLARVPVGVRLPGRAPGAAIGRARKTGVVAGALAAVAVVAWLTVWAGYRFSYESRALYPDATPPALAVAGPHDTLAARVPAMLKRGRLLPEAFVDGLGQALRGTVRQTYVAGEVALGRWDYFFITFLLKTPLALLVLLLLVPLAVGRLWRRHPLAVASLTIPVAVYLGVAIVTRLTIGHRHLLPIYPFLFVLVGAVVPALAARWRPLRWVVAALGAWYVLASASVFPHYLAYFNELGGGPDGGHRYLLDSNLDWGQDLKGLKRFMDERGIERVWLSYFGTASPAYHGIRFNYLPGYAPFLPPTSHNPPTPWVAISATNLHGVYLPTLRYGGWVPPRDLYRQYWGRRPVAKIGWSIFVYRLD